MNIPANALILVADGRKAMILRNGSDEKYPNLKSEWVMVEQNPSTAAQGTDRPGRVRSQNRRSSVEQTDWHAEAETAFAKRTAAALEELVRDIRKCSVVIVAPPRTLAVIRRSLRDNTQKRVIAELPHDLVNLAVSDIEAHLGRMMAAS
jgi:protein required for attachment to host cells